MEMIVNMFPYTYWSLVLLEKASGDIDVNFVLVTVLLDVETAY